MSQSNGIVVQPFKYGLLRTTQSVHAMLDGKGHPPHRPPHLRRPAHDFAVWKSDLYDFARRVFQPAGEGK